MPGENEGPLPGTGPGVNAQVARPRSQHCPRGPSPQGLLRSLYPHAPEALSSPGCPFPLGFPSSCSKSLLCVCAPGIVNFIQTLQVAVCRDCLLKVLPRVLPGGSKGRCTELGCAVCNLHSCMPQPRVEGGLAQEPELGGSCLGRSSDRDYVPSTSNKNRPSDIVSLTMSQGLVKFFAHSKQLISFHNCPLKE